MCIYTGDLVGGDWYSQYTPLEKDIVYCLDHYGSSMESALKKASDYSHHVVDTKWEQPAMAWARGVLAGHLGTAFKLIVTGISNGGMVALSICQAFPELQPRLWLASAPPASFQLAAEGYITAPPRKWCSQSAIGSATWEGRPNSCALQASFAHGDHVS